jgi:hypothetical protein
LPADAAAAHVPDPRAWRYGRVSTTLHRSHRRNSRWHTDGDSH